MLFPFNPLDLAPPIWYLRLHTSQCRRRLIIESWILKAWEKCCSPSLSYASRLLHVVSFTAWAFASAVNCSPCGVSGPADSARKRQSTSLFLESSAISLYLSFCLLQEPIWPLMIWRRAHEAAISCGVYWSQWDQSGSPLTGSGSATTYMWSAKAKIAKQMENGICMVVVLFSPATTSESPARAVVLRLQMTFYVQPPSWCGCETCGRGIIVHRSIA